MILAPACWHSLNHGLEIFAHGDGVQAAQAVVGPELQDDQIRFVLQRPAQAGPAAAGGVPGQAGVGHTDPAALVRQALVQQTLLQLGGERLGGGQVVACGQAVPKGQNMRLGPCAGSAGRANNDQGCGPGDTP
jgi:hypothetical protein